MMKKSLVVLICTIVLFLPGNVLGATQALDLEDTVVSAGFTPAFDVDKYSENEKQATVYLFRSPTCEHCHAAIEFFNKLASDEEYGSKFKLRSYDCQGNVDNKNLKNSVVSFFEIKAPGVPLIVIGDSTLYGFEESKENLIKQAIDKEYNSDEKYDVIDKMKEGKEEKKKSKTPYLVVGGIVLVGIILCILFIPKKK